jgi:hypothetical protein
MLLDAATYWYRNYGSNIPPPNIGAGPDGSIDLFWEWPQGQLLLNVASFPKQEAGYYGQTSAGSEVKGTVKLSDRQRWAPLLLDLLPVEQSTGSF